MRKFYRANLNGKPVAITEAKTPSSSWRLLEAYKNTDRKSLRALGWRVQLVIDLEESDAVIATEIAETLAPKPVKGIIGILKGLFK